MEEKKVLKQVLLYTIVGASSLACITVGLYLFYSYSSHLCSYFLFVAGFIGLFFLAGKALTCCFFSEGALRNVAMFVVKYFLYLIPLFAIVTKDVDVPHRYQIDIFTFIASFLPMIFTILVVSLSRQHDIVCGLDSHTFRKLRRDIHFSLMEMILIGIILFVTAFVFSTLNYVIALWILEFVSVCYSIYFLAQEVLVITNNTFYISFLRRGILRNDALRKKTLNGDDEALKQVSSIAASLIAEKGIRGLYDEIKDEE